MKVEFGRLALTNDVLTFTGDETVSVPVANIAWVEAGQRSRELTLEITSRQAQIHRFFITDVRWVQAVRDACTDLIKVQLAEPVRMAAAG